MKEITLRQSMASTLIFLFTEIQEFRALKPDEKELFRHINIAMANWAEEKEDECSRS